MIKLRHNANRNMKKKDTNINSNAPVRTATRFLRLNKTGISLPGIHRYVPVVDTWIVGLQVD